MPSAFASRHFLSLGHELRTPLIHNHVINIYSIDMPFTRVNLFVFETYECESLGFTYIARVKNLKKEVAAIYLEVAEDEILITTANDCYYIN